MPQDSVPVTILIRPPGEAPYALSLDRLTDHVHAARLLMSIRDEMKAKRLKAMGVVNAQMQETSLMYDRILTAGELVARARDIAEDAHMGALNEHMALLREDAEELAEFAQAAPTSGSGAPKPAPQSGGSAALQALMDAQPQPKGWNEGDAYVGTRTTVLPDTMRS